MFASFGNGKAEMLEQFNQRLWFSMNINENKENQGQILPSACRNDIKIMLLVSKGEKVPVLHEWSLFKKAYLEIYKGF